MPSKAPMIDKRPRARTSTLKTSAAPAAVVSAGAEGGAALKPSPRKRAIFTGVGAGLAVLVLLTIEALAWVIAHGFGPALWFAGIVLGAAIGWGAAREHVKRWGADGFGLPKA